MTRGRDALQLGASMGGVAARRVMNAAAAATGVDAGGDQTKRSKRNQGNSGVDVRKFRRRFVALELMYIGWAYHGFAAQFAAAEGKDAGDNENEGVLLLREEQYPTVEGMLFRALRRARLVDDRDTLQDLKYTKCGRTDRGVSALGNVVTLRLRSRQALGTSSDDDADEEEDADDDEEDSKDSVRDRSSEYHTGERDVGANCADDNGGESDPESARGDAVADAAPTIPAHEEMDYVAMLNRGLPADVRVLGWCDVPDDFSARFSCSWRQYKYFFTFDPGSGSGTGRGAIDIHAMRRAAKLLEGTHDFRNLCKMDIQNVLTFERTILMSTIEVENEAANIFSYNVRGTAFLYNQVRCIMALLMMIGKGREKPEIISTLLDVRQTPRKPEYVIADPEQLILHSVGYDGSALKWMRPPHSSASAQTILMEAQRSLALRNAMFASCLSTITHENISQPGKRGAGAAATSSNATAAEWTLAATVTAASIGNAGERHTPLMKRRVEPSYEEKRAKLDLKARAKRERSDRAHSDNDVHAMSVD